MRPIDADELMDLYKFPPEYAEVLHVPIPVVVQNIIDMPTLDYAPKWISVKDDLPAAVVSPCLIYADGWIQVADWSHDKYGNDWWFYVDGEYDPEVTHWMPLPEPPKEG